MHSWASLVAKDSNSTPLQSTHLTINCKHNDPHEPMQTSTRNESNVDHDVYNTEEVKASEESLSEQDIDMLDIEYDDTENDAQVENDLEQDFNAFLSLTIGERVLLLHIVASILSHQSAYNLLLCFRRYQKIFGEELYNESKNTLWFWKRLYLRDFGELIFRQKSNKHHSKSVAEQLKQFEFNKKHSASWWAKHYLSEYRLTVTVKHHISAQCVYYKSNKKHNLKRKQMVESVSFYPDANLYMTRDHGYRRRWFYTYTLRRVMILSQHKLHFDKILSVKSFVRCNWFLEIAHWNDIYTNKRTKSNPIIVKKLTNSRHHLNTDTFRGYVNRFDVRCMELNVVQIMVESSKKCNEEEGKIQKENVNKKCKLRAVELYSDIKHEKRVILRCANEHLQNRNEKIFAFKRMINFKQMMKDFYEQKGKHEPLRVHVLFFERLAQGIMINRGCLRKMIKM